MITRFLSLLILLLSNSVMVSFSERTDSPLSKHTALPRPPFTIFVKEGAPNLGYGYSWETARSTLQQALLWADSLTSIWVAEGTYFPDSAQSFILKKGVKIYGGFAGTETSLSQRNPAARITILKGNGNRVIYNNNNRVDTSTVLDGLTISGGTASLGAGIYNSNASPSIINCKFLRNIAVDSGGAIYNTNKSAPFISKCIFQENKSSMGAGICNYDSCSPTIVNCQFIENTRTQLASTGGGAIANINNSPIITGCSFTDNLGFAIASAMHNVNCAATISNCSFTSDGAQPCITNEASPVSIIKSNFYGNYGISINNFNSDITVNSCTFKGNRAAGIVNNNSSPAIINCLFSGNFNTAAGNSPCISNTSSSPVITNCTFAGNNCNNNSQGVIISAGSSVTVNNCIIWGNDRAIVNQSFASTTVRASIVQGGYSGFGNKSTDPLFLSSPGFNAAPTTGGNYVLRPNSPAYNAGNNAAIPAGVVTDLEGKPRIINNIVDMGAYEYRVTPAAGNILYVDQHAGSSNHEGDSWTNAITDLSYAMHYAWANKSNWTAANPLKIFVANATYLPVIRPDDPTGFSDPADRNNAFLMVPHVQLYGGFNPASGIDSLDDTRIFGSGGTILSGNIGAADSADNSYHVIVSSGDVGTALLDGFTITAGNNNLSDTGTVIVDGYAITRSWGGGLICNTSSPAIANCTFLRNNSVSGGGLFTLASSPAINNCTFTDNGSHFGGAVFAHTGSAPIITGSNFTGNRAYSYGGAVYNNSSQNIANYTNCNFSGNYTINYGGGGAGMFNNNSMPSINNCSFSNNVASTYGGGIWNYQSSSPAVDACSFTSNTAGLFGAGMYNETLAAPAISRSIFSSNSTHFGGGMFNAGPAQVSGCIFTNNSVASYGGGVYNSGSATASSFTNCIFTGNYTINYGGGGGGMFNNTTNTIVSKCTFQGNNATYGGAIHNWNTGRADVRNSLVWGNSSAIHNETAASAIVQYSNVQGGYAGTGNLNVNPLFVNSSQPKGPDGIWATADDGLRLQECSPAINAGSNLLVAAGVSTDIGGAARIQHGVVDMGAFEASVPGCGGLIVQKTPATISTIGISSLPMDKGNMLVYPNPVTDRVYISNATIGSSYSVFDNMGHKVKIGRISNALQEINMTGLTRGVYYIDITEAGSVSKKLKVLKR
jgi:hypothetical protein